MRKTTALAIFLIWLAVLSFYWFGVSSSTKAGLAIDDGYIHLVYARNLLRGHFFEYNTGEPSSGSTSPGWVVLLALLGTILGPLKSAWVLCALSLLLAGVGAYFLTYQMLRTLNPDNPLAEIAGTFAAATTLTYGRFVWNAFSGMETLFYSGIIAMIFGAFAWELRRGKNFWLTSALAFFAIWFRPESFLLIVLVPAFLLYAGKLLRRRTLYPALVVLSSAVFYFVFNLLLTGHPLPNTFFSKAALYSGTRWDYLAYTINLFWHDNPLLFLTALASVGVIIFAILKLPKEILPAALPYIWLILFPAAKFFVSYQEVHFGRYTVVIIPVLVSAVFVSAGAILRKLPRLSVWIFAALVILPNILLLPYWAKMTAKTVEQINTVHGECAEALGTLVKDKSQSVALHDVGRIKYDTDLPVVDLAGLVSNDVAQLIWQNRRRIKYSTIGFDSLAAEIIARYKPRYAALSVSWFPYLTANRLALKRLWQSRQIVDATECIPEIEIYRIKSFNLDTLQNFAFYGRKFDLQWTINNLLPDIKAYLDATQYGDSAKRAIVTSFVREHLEQQYPCFENSLLNLARELVFEGLVEDGAVAARLGANLYPQNAGFYNILGVYTSNKGQFDLARKYLARTVALEPRSPEYRANYSIVLLHAGDTAGALAQMDTVLAIDSLYAPIRKLRESIAKHSGFSRQ